MFWTFVYFCHDWNVLSEEIEGGKFEEDDFLAGSGQCVCSLYAKVDEGSAEGYWKMYGFSDDNVCGNQKDVLPIWKNQIKNLFGEFLDDIWRKYGWKKSSRGSEPNFNVAVDELASRTEIAALEGTAPDKK